jgi:1-acyl-sn-glycerol-3-phosphate acyltransferase
MSEPHSPSPQTAHTRPLEQPSYPAQRLRLTERAALALMERLNRPGWLQKVALLWGRHISQRLVQAIYLRRLCTFYDERLEGVPSDASVLIVANHRTFYDLFVIATALRVRSAHRLGVPSVFPVRSPFFYDNPLGVILCLFFSGGCMYPPVFRDERKHELNPVGVEVMRWLLTQPKVCLGIHPEGHRSKQPDHYTLEPPKRGVGVLLSDPSPNLYVLPVFVEGLNNSFGVELKRAFKGRSAEPVKVWWGEPVRAQELSGEPEALASHAHALIQTLADHAKAVS